uniref:Uncharacterized protein n=1 Tax=Clytia hemisphaerica TaxID=252671 RepID=A0A7M5V4J8_9CNID
ETFKPSGARQFQSFEFSPFPPRLFQGTTPLYVLDTKHPDIPGESIESTSSECYYRTVLNVFGPSQGITRQCKRDEPERRFCTFYHFCVEEKVNITVRHCGSHYVYKLKPVRILQRNRFFEIPKSGLYCGTKNETIPEPRAPCICQVKKDVQEILDQTKCQVDYEGNDRKVLKSITKCLKKERKMILKELKVSSKCHIKLNKALWRKKAKKFTKENLKSQISGCESVKKTLIKGVYNRLALTRKFTTSKLH